jgi:ribulose-phosphate 3-epimerase
MAPSVLDADFGHLAAQIAAVEEAGADVLHLDVMDGHFVPNLSIGVPVVAGIKRHTRLFLDTHLMITDPGAYAKPFAEAGADSLTFHIEVADEPQALIKRIRDLGMRVGVSLNPGTPADDVLEILPLVDIVLVMTVWPGFGGQKFITDCLEKIAVLHQHRHPDLWIEVDGGINKETIVAAVQAGADTLVAGSAIFGQDDPGAALKALRAAAEGANSEARKTA